MTRKMEIFEAVVLIHDETESLINDQEFNYEEGGGLCRVKRNVIL